MYDENNLQELGINIKLLRARYKINQYELAQALEISQTHMSNIESGRVQINLRLLLRAANFFHCKLDDFFEIENFF